MAATGVVLDAAGFELLVAGVRVGRRRTLAPSDVSLLEDVTARYVRAVSGWARRDTFLGLGQELYSWLDGDGGGLGAVVAGPGPVVFEVQASASPSSAGWAVLRAPWELLAAPSSGGFLVEDGLLRLCVVRRLGRPVGGGKLDGFRLGLGFMASSPRGRDDLDYEAEEAAILSAVGIGRVDLLVEDTGDPVQFGRRLADVGGMPVVHLSCHGHNAWPQPDGTREPVLMLEDDQGGERPTTAADLVRRLRGVPRLVFVSACLTATGAGQSGWWPPAAGERGRDVVPRPRPASAGVANDGGGVAHSLATALVAAGVPAVLGWDGSVRDRAATVFAGHLYAALGEREDLAVAVGDARRALLDCDVDWVRADWHLARLWLGPAGGGPVAGGTRKRSLVAADRGTKAFLDRKQHVRVADRSMFVNRRQELQQALRVLRGGDRVGVLLHGQGRLGKSSLAARVVDRLPEYAVAVVYGDYTALAVLDAVADAVRALPQAREVIDRGLPDVRDEVPQALERVLVDLLSGPCAQIGDGQRPLLLVIDDLEQILEDRADGAHRVTADAAPVLAAVLRAFTADGTDSRLLLTSRYTFTLDGLQDRVQAVQLRPLSPVAQAKLQLRQQGLAPAGLQADRAGLAERAVAVARGNPGLQDLIGLRLVYDEAVDTDRAERAVADMEAYLDRGDALPAEEQVRTFLEDLAIDTLLDQAGPAHRGLARALTVFDQPIPRPVADLLAGQVGGSLDRMCGLGLADAYPNPAHPAQTAVAVNPLAAGRLAPLSEAEAAAVAVTAVGPLHTAWRGPCVAADRDGGLDVQLTRLGLLADHPDVVAECAAHAVNALRQGPAGRAYQLGRDAIELLDRHHVAVPLWLLRQTADAALTSGDGSAGDALMQRAVNQIDIGDQDGGSEPLDHARVLYEYAVRLQGSGQPEQAMVLLHRAEQLFATHGSDREAAVTWGSIADIAYQRGDYDEALRIRRELELPVYERLGDTRSTAVTWGRIADIAYDRGDYDEALRIRREVQLPVYERLGDTRSTAVTWGRIADIAYQRGDYDEAQRIRREVQLPVYERLGDTRSTAITWGQIADIAYDRGDYDEAQRIRREIELPVYERLGDTRSTAITWGQIADIAYDRGDYDEALRIRREVQLPVYERLGDTRETAITWGRIADIAYQRGDYDEALRIRREVQLPVFERLGDTRSTAITWGNIADIAYDRGDYDEALRIRREVQLPVYERLGDTRSTAITWGNIADIAYQRGDYEQAAELRQRELEANEQLGDLDGIAAATWGLAQIDLARQDYQTAAPRLVTAYQILTRLQRPDGIAIVGNILGQLLLAAGQPEDATTVLTTSLQAATKIGATELAGHLTTLLNTPPDKDQNQEPLHQPNQTP
ncbi:tetratricopeptide repeat protein [Dactylosporangium sp. CA-139066]|uniref:tetratricopeptide repeat protein n=1 Tax=Dactylosporangium sp. CA-139066 TaxID=3239930 RepID=UPI003D8C7501